MGIDEIGVQAGEYLITQGILGIATMMLAAAVVFLWRDNRAQRQRYDEDLIDQRNRHAQEVAAERKANAELQEARLNELKQALDAVKQFTGTVDTAMTMLRGRSE